MVEIITYEFKTLTDHKVKPEDSSIKAYVNECLESKVTIISTFGIKIVLDAKYEKADLNKFMEEQCQHLRSNKRETLLHILEKIKLVQWNTGYVETPLVNLDLKDDATPMCSRPYQVPRVHKTMFRK